MKKINPANSWRTGGEKKLSCEAQGWKKENGLSDALMQRDDRRNQMLYAFG